MKDAVSRGAETIKKNQVKIPETKSTTSKRKSPERAEERAGLLEDHRS